VRPDGRGNEYLIYQQRLIASGLGSLSSRQCHRVLAEAFDPLLRPVPHRYPRCASSSPGGSCDSIPPQAAISPARRRLPTPSAPVRRSIATSWKYRGGVLRGRSRRQLHLLQRLDLRHVRLRRSEVRGMNNRAYTSPETAKRMFSVFSEIYCTGRPRTMLDYEIIRKDGMIKSLDSPPR